MYKRARFGVKLSKAPAQTEMVKASFSLEGSQRFVPLPHFRGQREEALMLRMKSLLEQI